nr:unnamed protein product [Callosobruchus analis]
MTIFQAFSTIISNMALIHQISTTVTEKEYLKCRQKRKNRSKLALRNEGKEYYSTRTRKRVPARKLLDRCESAQCEKFGKKCGALSDKEREEIVSISLRAKGIYSFEESLLYDNANQSKSNKEQQKRFLEEVKVTDILVFGWK